MMYVNRHRFFEIALLVEGGLGVAAVLLAWPLGLRLWNYFSVDPRSVAVSIAATGLAVLFYFVLRFLPLASLRRTVELVRMIYRNEMRSLSPWKLALLAASAGIGEELLFRGLLQKGLCTLSGGNELTVIVLTSVLFGLLHCVSKTYVVLAFLISLYLGFLFLWTDNLFVPTTIHALYDFFVFLHLRWEYRSVAVDVDDSF